jgi:hypothetical protein
MSRKMVTRSQINEPAAGPSNPPPSRRDVAADAEMLEDTFRSFTARRFGASTPAQRHNPLDNPPTSIPTSTRDTLGPVPPPQDNPTPPVDPPSDNDEGGNSTDTTDKQEQANNILAGLAEAIAALARSANRPPPPPLEAARRVKNREPDQFDGSEPRKLRTFLLQLQLNIRDNARSFPTESSKVMFALSYLKGAALDWFEPDLLGDPNDLRSPWMDDFEELVHELERNFGPHNPAGEAENQLITLVMKDSQRISKYIVEFNRHASQVRGFGGGALRLAFYNGLPDRIKDKLTRIGKPEGLYELRELAQTIDARYWERKGETSRLTRPVQSTSTSTSKFSDRSADKPSFAKSATPNTPSSSTSSFKKAPKDNTSGGKPFNKTDLSTKLGKDGKLTPEERQRRVDNNLCMFCGKSGHVARECYKSSSRAAKARKARPANPESDADVLSGTKN